MEVSAYTVSVRGGGGGSLEKPCLGPPRRRRSSSSLLTLVPLPRTINAQHSSFCDKAHLRYYYDHRRHTNYSHVVSASSSNKTNKKEKEKEKKKKKKKKTTTTVDGLSTEHKLQLLKSFSNACSISADPLHSDDNVLEEAAEVFLKRLEQLSAEEKQLKRIRKQEKANLLKAARIMDDSSSSSSSSSESSSDSECGEVIDMSSLRSKLPSRSHQQGHHPGPDTQAAALATVPCLPTHQHQQVPERGGAAQLQNLKKGCECTTGSGSVDGCGTRVEVCMGSKCNKSGGAALLAEFRRQMGPDAAAVVACKCMGKCRSAPNVRVCNENDETAMAMATATGTAAAAVRIPIPTANPLYIGVGLEDVSSIVDNLLGQHNIGFLQPPLPASP